METTFMTIHSLTPDATILYSSDSVSDILGYEPEEIRGRSCFDYFHPDEVPFAQYVHNRTVRLDKAAVLHYARIRARDGQWVGCECVITVVYDVLVACTSIYRGDEKNLRRAEQAPAVRRIFTASPRDPRYHMLEHLSAKFRTPLPSTPLEPRAALMLNRFTRTLSVLYATNAVEDILGVTPAEFTHRSFYECIHQDCRAEAVRCLESAKANDSIAYLRFRYKDPREADDENEPEAQSETSQDSDSEEGGVRLRESSSQDDKMDVETSMPSRAQTASSGGVALPHASLPRTISEQSSEGRVPTVFDNAAAAESSSSSLGVSPVARQGRRPHPQQRASTEADPVGDGEFIELEAVVSCTSDGLVVVLRRARPMPPAIETVAPNNGQGFFAAPWGVDPVHAHVHEPQHHRDFHHGLQAPVQAGGPTPDLFLRHIQEVAVFAWALTGINGNIAQYGRGDPHGEAQPPTGFPVWDPYAPPDPGYAIPQNQAYVRWQQMAERGGGWGGPLIGSRGPYGGYEGWRGEGGYNNVPRSGMQHMAGTGGYDGHAMIHGGQYGQVAQATGPDPRQHYPAPHYPYGGQPQGWGGIHDGAAPSHQGQYGDAGQHRQGTHHWG